MTPLFPSSSNFVVPQGSAQLTGGAPGLQIRCEALITSRVGSIPMHFRHTLLFFPFPFCNLAVHIDGNFNDTHQHLGLAAFKGTVDGELLKLKALAIQSNHP